jgi:hypothetical protein
MTKPTDPPAFPGDETPHDEAPGAGKPLGRAHAQQPDGKPDLAHDTHEIRAPDSPVEVRQRSRGRRRRGAH